MPKNPRQHHFQNVGCAGLALAVVLAVRVAFRVLETVVRKIEPRPEDAMAENACFSLDLMVRLDERRPDRGRERRSDWDIEASLTEAQDATNALAHLAPQLIRASRPCSGVCARDARGLPVCDDMAQRS